MGAVERLRRRLTPSSAERERGSILVLATVGVVVAMVASALSVDLGRQAQEKRFDQKVADLAALDAVRGLTDGSWNSRAVASATRNGFAVGAAGHVLDVKLGTLDPVTHQFTQPGTDTVQVKASSPVDYAFVPGSGSVTATAVAQNQSRSSFSLGSSLLNIDSTRSSLLNQTLTKLLGASGSVNVLSYQGLANSAVTLGALKSQLGFSALSVKDFLDTSVSLASLYSATAVLLGPGGTSQVDMNGLSAKASGSAKLGDLITVAPGADGAAMATEMNVLQLVVGSAELANPTTGTGFSIPNLGITVPLSGITNLTSGTVSVGVNNVTITHAPVTYVGPAGGSISTAQLTATVNSLVNLNVQVAGVGLVNVTGTIPVQMSGANATGILQKIYCGSPAGIDVNVSTSAVNTPTVSFSLAASTLGIGLAPVTGSTTVGLAQGSFTPVPPTVSGNPSFLFPSEFFPPGSSSSTKHVGVTTVNPTLTWTSGGLVAPVVGPVLQAVENQVASAVVEPLLQALGTDMASADVTANKIVLPDGSLGIDCGTPALVS